MEGKSDWDDDGDEGRRDRKSIRSLLRQIEAHRRKLEEFRRNPTIRAGMEGLPQELIFAQQKKRIRKLRRQIRVFQQNIRKILATEKGEGK